MKSNILSQSISKILTVMLRGICNPAPRQQDAGLQTLHSLFLRGLLAIIFTLIFSKTIFAQETKTDTTKITMNEVVISVNKEVETKRTVAQQIQVMKAADIAEMQAQTTADVIANTGNISVQKSQQGGGSPVIRGFEASRVLLMIDGVRMNNLIYRAGHFQNIITTDNAILEYVEILYGPSSTIYGSDALGGVIHLYTKTPLLATLDQKLNLKVNAFARYGSVNKEKTGHVDVNLGGSKLASLTSFTYSDFDNLRGGANQNPYYDKPYGERPYYAERFSGKDSLVKNSDRYLQVQSGYTQYDLLQKILFRPHTNVTHGLNIQYSNSTDVPRYDRLTDPKGTGLNSAEWYYGPQTRLLAAYDYDRKMDNAFFRNIHFGLNFQDIEESRHNRNFGSNFRNNRIENVQVFGADLDFHKTINNHNLRFGFDGQFNTLESTASRENIVVDTLGKLDSRYPDGDNIMNNYALYVSHTWGINEKIILTDGFRIGYSSLHSTLVDTATLFHLPYTDIKQNMPVYSGTIGLINNPSDNLKLSLLLSTGFRVPNVDDLSSIFGSTVGRVRVPNPDLEPEKTVNTEVGMTNIFNGKTRLESYIYHTMFTDVIVLDTFRLNGQDSLLYNNTPSRIYANQNKGRAYIYGFSTNLHSQCTDQLAMSLGLNYTYGRIKTDSSDAPLDHIPPFMARLQLTYSSGKFMADFFINYNGWKRLKDYNLSGEDNLQYATPDGMPAWYTLNLHFSYKVHRLITLQTGVDNIFDTQYRVFASGINSAGRNVFGAIRFHY